MHTYKLNIKVGNLPSCKVTQLLICPGCFNPPTPHLIYYLFIALNHHLNFYIIRIFTTPVLYFSPIGMKLQERRQFLKKLLGNQHIEKYIAKKLVINKNFCSINN